MRLWSESPWQRLHYGFHLPIAMETRGGAQSCVEKRKEMDGDREREGGRERESVSMMGWKGESERDARKDGRWKKVEERWLREDEGWSGDPARSR